MTSDLLFDGKSFPIKLGNKIKKGGEGTIFELRENTALVAKVYSARVGPEKEAKLRAMIGLKNERLSKLSAWPTNTLHDKPSGQVVGFLMPRITGHKDIHMLYGVKSRLAEYPDARWPFLIQTATNIARAFQVVHQHGLVIGDVNFGSVLVSRQATVKLVDCDSFQIIADDNQYLCEVGEPNYTPPELQGLPFRGIVRTVQHDMFGLAVIIFQLLFMGRHPFAGEFLGKGDKSIDQAIKEYRFAYGPQATERQMRQPPATLPLEAVSSPVARLFEQSFLAGMSRPATEEWITELSNLSLNLKQCAQNGGHYHLNSLTSCPWCEMEMRSGITYFGYIYTGVLQFAADIGKIWKEIKAIPSPDPLPVPHQTLAQQITLSPVVTEISRVRLIRSFTAAAGLLVVSAVLLASAISGGLAIWLIIIFAAVAIAYEETSTSEMRRELKQSKADAEQQLRVIEQQWSAQCDSSRYIAKFTDFKTQKEKYDDLPNLRSQKLRQLEITAKERQLHKFLDNHRIATAEITGVKSGRKAILRSYGIETADDVSDRSIRSIPGFGPYLTGCLMDWRKSVERKFIFNPAKAIDTADIQAIEKDIASIRNAIEQQLRNAPEILNQIKKQILSARESIEPAIIQAQKSFGQTTADLKMVSLRLRPLAPIVVVFAIVFISAFALKPDLRPSRVQTDFMVRIEVPVTPQNQIGVEKQPALLKPDQEAQSHFDEGVNQTRNGNDRDAVESFKLAISLKPQFAEAEYQLAIAYYRLGKYVDAVAASKQALRLKPDKPETYLNLASSFQALKEWRESIKAFKKAIELGPDDALTRSNLAVVYRHIGDHQSAIDQYKIVARMHPFAAPAHYELGVSYLKIGDRAKAIEEYKILIPLDKEVANKLDKRINSPGVQKP